LLSKKISASESLRNLFWSEATKWSPEIHPLVDLAEVRSIEFDMISIKEFQNIHKKFFRHEHKCFIDLKEEK
tara:strand:- start:292 stop:507 length:216 start_codon:yes stop_codon:yes gene_type:complete